jgi:ketosteroid isomerase-like protein
MKKIILPVILGVSCAFMYSCNDAKTGTVAADSFNLDSVKTAIAASNATYGSGFAAQDSVGFISHYTSDACVNPTGVPQICGTQGITAFFNMAHQMGIRDIKLTTKEVMGGKDAVVETGTYEVLGAQGVSFEKGKFIVVWKEENGKWKMHRDIWNSDAPAPPPPPAPAK